MIRTAVLLVAVVFLTLFLVVRSTSSPLYLLALSLITGFVGFVFGVYIAMSLGLSQYDTYDYYSPNFFVGARGFIGLLLFVGGPSVGALLPWLSYWSAIRLGR
jgi:hypothetical protein